MTIDVNNRYQATLETTEGTIIIDLFAKETPRTVNNFVFLARDGFYDGVRFHRILKGFMVQSGDPLGNGTGGPGYAFPDEPVTRDYTPGIVAMANAGPNTNGSQFFIMHGTADLPKAYTIFGQVTQGQEVVDRIASTSVGPGLRGELSRPLKDILVLKVTIQEMAPGQ
jgi:cyclophilin family peptidyl-prolyl cis-trans isomerase